jgi:hypothetical protein
MGAGIVMFFKMGISFLLAVSVLAVCVGGWYYCGTFVELMSH